MSAGPRLAAVVATYNGEKYVGEQLRSILDQTRPPDLVVITDDGSTDATLPVCEELAASSAVPVTVLRRPAGLARLATTFDDISANFVRGVAAAGKCDLYAFSDQDDVWCADRLETSLETLRQAPSSSFVFGDGALIDELGVETGTRLSEQFHWPPDWNELSPAQQLRFAIRQPFATGATMVLTARLLRAALPVPDGWLLDRWVSIIGSALGGSRTVQDPVIKYRLHGGQQVGVSGASTQRPRLMEILARNGSPLGPARKTLDVRRRVRRLDVPGDVRAQVGWPEIARLVSASMRGRR